MVQSSEINKDKIDHLDLLQILVEGGNITSEKFEKLVRGVDHHDVIAKVFILEGTPHVFAKSPMKYMVFREQVAERFEVVTKMSV